MAEYTREELIAALVTDKYSGFKNGDESMLGAASDARLDEFRSASEVHRQTSSKIAQMEADIRQTQARLKVAEEARAKAEQPMTDEEFVLRAPASIKTVLEQRAAEEATLKTSLVNSLKDKGPETEEQLMKKSIPELQILAEYAKVRVLDFGGRGVPVERNATSHVSYAPPDPYAEGIKRQREAEAARR